MKLFSSQDNNGKRQTKLGLSGFVVRQQPRCTDVVTQDGITIHANPRPDLFWGAPVGVRLFNRLHDGSWDGKITDCAYPVLGHPDNRPLAVIDEANTAGLGEPDDIAAWVIGAVKTFALGVMLDLAGYRPFFAADPYNRQAFLRHPPSAKALQAISLCKRWDRPPPRDHGLPRECADCTALAVLRDHPGSILLTRDKFDKPEQRKVFPELAEPDFRARIHKPVVRGDTISVPSLGLSLRMPLAAFGLQGCWLD